MAMFAFRGVRSADKPRPRIITVAVLFVLAMFCLILFMERNINVYDEGIILSGAARAMDGAVIHRDFYTNYGPGQFYVLAALFKMFGASVLTERIWDTVVRSCSIVLVFIIVGRVAPYWLAVSASAVSLLWLGAFGFYGYPVFPALAADLAGLVFLIPVLGGVGRRPAVVAAGACAGLATLFRYDVGLATFAAEGAILAASVWLGPLKRPDRLRAVAHVMILFSLGFTIVVGPAGLALAFAGAIPDFVFDVVTYSARLYAQGRALPFPGLTVLRVFPSEAVVYLPPFICLVAVLRIVTILRHRRNREDDVGPDSPIQRAELWTLLTLSALTLLFFAKGWVRVQTIHMAMALIGSVAMAAVLARSLAERGMISRSLVSVALLGVCAWSFCAVQIDWSRAVRNVAWATGPTSSQVPADGLPALTGSCHMPDVLARLDCIETSAATAETIQYVEQRTTPDDPLFVGLSRHDKIFANDVLLYFALNRRPATKWYQFDPGLQTSAPIQQEIIGELERTKPKLIVLEAQWSDVKEPNGSALSDATLLDDYLRQTFEPAATFGQNSILQRRSAASDAPAG